MAGAAARGRIAGPRAYQSIVYDYLKVLYSCKLYSSLYECTTKGRLNVMNVESTLGTTYYTRVRSRGKRHGSANAT